MFAVAGHVHAVRGAAIALSRTPEVHVAAIGGVSDLAEFPEAGGQGAEPEGIRTVAVATVAVAIPAALRLENLTRGRLTAHRRDQDVPFRLTG